MTQARDIAMEVLRRIEDESAYSHLALGYALTEDVDSKERGFATQLVYGTLTWRSALDALIAKKSKRPLVDIDPVVLRALRVATYQLVFLRVPNHAVLDQAVTFVKTKVPPAGGFVNGILRSLTRDKEHIWWRDTDRAKKPVRYLSQRYAMPSWISNRLQQTLGVDDAEALLKTLTEAPPVWARQRQSFAAPQEWEAGPVSGSFRVPNINAVLKHLDEKTVVIQDIGAQMATATVGDVTGKSVLDLCAGLGGKALALADKDAQVTAVEPNKKRLALVDDPKITCVVSDAQDFAKVTDQTFDAVFVDAPCSGLGVMRRHPETKWTKKESDVTSLSAIQAEILDAAAKLTKPGGLLVYCVCTFTREETTKQVEKFLAGSDEKFTLEPFESDGLSLPEGHLQLWPHRHGSDAFYIARMRKSDG